MDVEHLTKILIGEDSLFIYDGDKAYHTKKVISCIYKIMEDEIFKMKNTGIIHDFYISVSDNDGDIFSYIEHGHILDSITVYTQYNH
jgi:hypothetical protein